MLLLVVELVLLLPSKPVTLTATLLCPGGQAVYPPTFSRGVGAILLDDVGCVGNETSLTECSHVRSSAHDCSHSEDAGASCTTDENCECSSCRRFGIAIIKSPQ